MAFLRPITVQYPPNSLMDQMIHVIFLMSL